MRAHLWLAGFPKGAEEQADISADCHRRLRGPYTGTAAVLRVLVPEIVAQNPELARRHVIEILAMAPEQTKAWITGRRMGIEDRGAEACPYPHGTTAASE